MRRKKIIQGWKVAVPYSLFLSLVPLSLFSISFLPFKGYRPREDLQHKIVSPPYNFLTPQEASTLAEKNPLSFLHVSSPEVDLPPTTRTTPSVAGELGHNALQEYIAQGFLVQDQSPSFYLYRQKKVGLCSLGIIGLISVKHYEDNMIKRHENTIPEKEGDLTTFINAQEAETDPVVLTYRSKKKISEILHLYSQQVPDQSIALDDGSSHEIWVINSAEDIQIITNIFANLKSVYIADGHHRSAAANNLYKKYQALFPTREDRPHNYYLAALFPDKQIALGGYNRIIRTLNGLSEKKFLSLLRSYFSLREVESHKKATPKDHRSFGMYLRGKWYILRVKRISAKLPQKRFPLNQLDSTILNETIIKPILGIESLNDVKNIQCIGGSLGLKALEDKCIKMKWDIAFAVFPVTTQTFIDIVDQGFLMPAKTTWFEPKIWQGLIVRTFNVSK